MGRSGTTSLWSSGLTGYRLAQAQDSQFVESIERAKGRSAVSAFDCAANHRKIGVTHITQPMTLNQSYRVKPHEQLVPVSLTHYCASTPSLSTSWSRTTLQGAQGPGKTHLETSFPLRCFQRLSLPHLATRQCHWRDNRYTRGASTPVLSY